MRFNKDKYPVLKYIDNKTFETYPNSGEFYHSTYITKELPLNRKEIQSLFFSLLDIKDNIFYFSKNVLNNVIDSEKFREFMIDKCHLLKSEKGLLITPLFQFMYEINNKNPDVTISFITFNDDSLQTVARYTLENVYNQIFINGVIKHSLCLSNSLDALIYILKLLVFKELIDIETIILKPKEKRIINNQKTLNELKNNIHIIDMNYFQTSIRNQEFKVKGHLRFQPFGENRNKTKLIWIEEFIKKGYIKNAKKVNERKYS